MRYLYHRNSYILSLREVVIPTELKLMKKPAINYISDGLERQWNNVVYNAEKRVVTLLLSESGTFQGSYHKTNGCDFEEERYGLCKKHIEFQ